jgi:hypothetical protein
LRDYRARRCSIRAVSPSVRLAAAHRWWRVESSASCTALRAKWPFLFSRRVSYSAAAASSVTAALSPVTASTISLVHQIESLAGVRPPAPAPLPPLCGWLGIQCLYWVGGRCTRGAGGCSRCGVGGIQSSASGWGELCSVVCVQKVSGASASHRKPSLVTAHACVHPPSTQASADVSTHAERPPSLYRAVQPQRTQGEREVP